MIKGTTKIWILEDDPSCEAVYRETLDYCYSTTYFPRLELFNIALDEVNQKPPGPQKNQTVIPEIIIADIKLEDGFFTDYIQEKGLELLPCPYFVVSTYDSLDLFHWCSNRGSMDIIIKPFRKNELLFKLEKLLDKSSSKHIQRYLERLNIQLTSRENQILELFLNRSKAVTHEEIVREIWKGVSIHENNVNVQISRLREKLQGTPYKILHMGEKSWILDKGRII